jgi:hypothetical protein
MKIWFNESSALALREVSTALRCVLKNEDWHRVKNEELHVTDWHSVSQRVLPEGRQYQTLRAGE